MDISVFICFTPYQLLNAVYYAEKLQNKSKSILIWHNYTKYNICLDRFDALFNEIVEISNFYEESFFKRQYHKCLYGGFMFFRSNINKVLATLDFSKTVLFLFSDQHIISRKILTKYGNSAKDVILVEEGMATYLIRSHKVPKSKDWLINLILGANYEPYIGANKLIRTIFVKHPDMLPLEKKGDRLIVEQDNVFRDAIWGRFFGDALNTMRDKHLKHNSILWLGQPLDLDGVSSEEQIDWLESILRALPDDYEICIKPHPREAEGKYKRLNSITRVTVLNLKDLNWIPIEIIASLIKPKIILTAFSTAANNILELGIPCKVVYCYRAFNLGLGKEIDLYLNANPNVYCIKNSEELLSILNTEYKGTCSSYKNKNADIDYIVNCFEC